MSQNLSTIAHGFFQKMAPKSPLSFITFSDTLLLLLLILLLLLLLLIGPVNIHC